MDGAIQPGCPRVDNVIKKDQQRGSVSVAGTSTSAAEISTSGDIISTGVAQKSAMQWCQNLDYANYGNSQLLLCQKRKKEKHGVSTKSAIVSNVQQTLLTQSITKKEHLKQEHKMRTEILNIDLKRKTKL